MALLIRLTGVDVARVRFGISPVFETLRALHVLARPPGEHPIHLPWIRRSAPVLPDDPDVRLLRRLLTGWAVPIALLPPPDTRLPDLPHELHRIHRADPDRVRDSLDEIYGQRPWLAEFRADPPAVLARLTGAIERCYQTVIAAHWPRMRAILEADIDYRAKQLTDGGVEQVIRGLHPKVHWADAGHVVVKLDRPDKGPAVIEMSGAGLVLCPTVFGWPHATASRRPMGAATIRYPARGIATLWELPVQRPAAAIGELLGATRAGVLAALAEPSDTPTLARRLGVTASAVSQHLRVLRDAGLVATQRHGRSALHLRTARADALLDIGPPANKTRC